MSEERNTASYPVLLLRIKAMFCDGAILGCLIMALASLTGPVGIESTILKALFVFGPPLLLEPMMVWLTGGSFGHHYAGIRVVSNSTGNNLFVLNGLVRFVVKTVLGLYSLLSLWMTKRHQALHDLLSNSVVVFKHEATALPHHKRAARVVGAKPSWPRRV